MAFKKDQGFFSSKNFKGQKALDFDKFSLTNCHSMYQFLICTSQVLLLYLAQHFLSKKNYSFFILFRQLHFCLETLSMPKELAEKHKQKTCFKYLRIKFLKFCGFLRLISNKDVTIVITNVQSVFWFIFCPNRYAGFAKFWKNKNFDGRHLVTR